MVLAPPSRKGPKDQRCYAWLNWGVGDCSSAGMAVEDRQPQAARKRKRAVVLSPRAELALIETALDTIAALVRAHRRLAVRSLVRDLLRSAQCAGR